MLAIGDERYKEPAWVAVEAANTNNDVCDTVGSTDRSIDWQKYQITSAVKSGGSAIVIGIIIALLLGLIKKWQIKYDCSATLNDYLKN